MEEQKLPIGIDSEIAHVQSEIDRVDAIFTVPTGPMGHQEINYHIIDEERKQSIPRTSLTIKSSQVKVHTANTDDSEILNKSSDNHILNHVAHHQTSDDNDRKARFLLPEIDSTKQSENKYPTKKMYISLKQTQKEQMKSNKIIHMPRNESEQTSSRSSWNEGTFTIPERCRPNMNNILQQQTEILVPFYTLNDLAQHNHSTDAWICIFDRIYDVTSLIQKVQGTKLYQQLISYAGQDISLWFDEITHEPRRRIHHQTYESVSIIENLSLLQAEEFFIARLSTSPRYIRLIHSFTLHHPYIMEVAEEETIGQIAIKFLKYNTHIFSYIWRYNGQILDYNKTLTENGIPNEESFHDRYGWRSDNENCPTIILCFSDDLTIA
ncbi:hypothetical protein I4U23_019144 [Adineta vaga]|nr:hypothetical protein I4U23_019144 [Adineta vaga]